MTAQAARVLRPRSAGTASAQRPAAQARPTLSVVHALTPSRSTLPFLGLVISLLLTALGVALLLNALMARTAGDLHRTREAAAEAREASVVLQAQLDQRSSSAALSDRARSLGMVPADMPGLVDLGSGSVTGGRPAQAPKAPDPRSFGARKPPAAAPAVEAPAPADPPPAPTPEQTP